MIYDAEDRPEPDQLRRALRAFVAGGDDLPACRRGLPSTTPPTAGWRACSPPNMPGSSTCSCPALPPLRLPLPLGGSSNHFRTATLREVGGWDPYNVTEDADLGMRLARFGYRTAIDRFDHLRRSAGAPRRLAAPAHALVQRLDADLAGAYAHAGRLARELGLRGFLAFQLIVGGNALAALVHPLFMATIDRPSLARRSGAATPAPCRRRSTAASLSPVICLGACSAPSGSRGAGLLRAPGFCC